MRATVDALVRIGLDRGELLAAGGLKPGDLEDPDARVSPEACRSIFAHAQQRRPTKNLALQVAANTPIGAYPLIDYLVVTSDTVGAGAKQLARYLRLIQAPVHMQSLEHEDPVRVVIESNPYGVEYCTSLNTLHFRAETEGRFHAVHLSFRHRPDDVGEFERMLGCPVFTEQAWSGMVISRAVWALPLRRRDPILRGTLEQHADEIARRLPAAGIDAEMSRVLASRMTGGDLGIGAVARELGVSARTLQRRLMSSGLSYKDLVDSARREAALRYLSDPSLSIAEIAWLLGYSEASAFHRAFKRWMGSGPQSWRANRAVS
jgi:AraC-like DNA-binding protein